MTTPEGARSSVGSIASSLRPQSATLGIGDWGQGAAQGAVSTPPAPQVPTVGAAGLRGALSGLSDRLTSSLSALPFQAQTQPYADLSRRSLAPLLAGGRGGLGDPKLDLGYAVNARIFSRLAAVDPGSSTGGSIDYDALRGRYGPLVDPPKGPGDLMLQRRALLSLNDAGLPLSAILGGSYRSNAQQASYYARNPRRYAPPGMSLHEYGLAIDVNSGYLAANPGVRDRLLAQGWYQERPDEPFHFSFGVFNPEDVRSGQRRNQSSPAPTGRRRNQQR